MMHECTKSNTNLPKKYFVEAHAILIYKLMNIIKDINTLYLQYRGLIVYL